MFSTVWPGPDRRLHRPVSMTPFVPHPLTGDVIRAAIDVHRGLGPGLLESVYEECLAWELHQRRIPFRRQVSIGVAYKDVHLQVGFRADFLVNDELLVELKAVERMLPLHHAQVISYLRLLELHRGLLINFNVPRLTLGIRSFLNGPPPDPGPGSAASSGNDLEQRAPLGVVADDPDLAGGKPEVPLPRE